MRPLIKDNEFYKELVDTKLIYELKPRRVSTPGYTYSIAWNYPKFAMKFYNHDKGTVRLETFGIEVCDVNRAEVTDSGQIIFVSRTSHAINASVHKWLPEPRLVEVHCSVLKSRNNRLRVCLTRD